MFICLSYKPNVLKTGPLIHSCQLTELRPNLCPDITQAIQDITSIKPRQKFLAKKVLKKKELTPKDVMDSGQEEKNGGVPEEAPDEETGGFPDDAQEDWVKRKEQRPVFTGVSPQDVPDGAQISKAFDTLCNIVRDRMRKYKKPEPIADFYTKGRYVLVTGDGSYPHPCFCSTTPSAGHIYVTIREGMTPPNELHRHDTPSPPPQPQPAIGPTPVSPTEPSNGGGGKKDDKGGKGKEDNGGKAKSQTPEPKPKEPSPVPPPSGPSPGPKDPTPAAGSDKKSKDDVPSGPTPKPAPRGTSTSSSSTSSSGTSTSSGSFSPEAMSYEKLEVVESVEKFSNDRKVKGYEETSMVVETMIEKSTKKKH